MGYVYCIQPAELVGTHRYKIGMSSLNNLNRIRSYKVGTRYLCMIEREDALATERKIKKAFNERYALIAGNEYFEVDDEPAMVQLFIATVMGYTFEAPITSNHQPTRYRPISDRKPYHYRPKPRPQIIVESIKIDNPPTDWMNQYAFNYLEKTQKPFRSRSSYI